MRIPLGISIAFAATTIQMTAAPATPPPDAIERLVERLSRWSVRDARPGYSGVPDEISATLRERGPIDANRVVQALEAAAARPTEVSTRFIAACLLGRAGRQKEARVLLRPLATARRCPACADALTNVSAPACRFDARTRRLGRSAKTAPRRRAADAILAALNSGESRSVARYIDRGQVEIRRSCGVCDGDRLAVTRYRRDEFLRFVRQAARRMGEGPVFFIRPALIFCDGRCCGGPPGGVSHTSLTVGGVCFRGSDAAPRLDSIFAVEG